GIDNKKRGRIRWCCGGKIKTISKKKKRLQQINKWPAVPDFILLLMIKEPPKQQTKANKKHLHRRKLDR
ncbi:hypothetical protein LRK_09540, partial [Lacticaseibacillus rhamnosus K32]